MRNFSKHTFFCSTPTMAASVTLWLHSADNYMFKDIYVTKLLILVLHRMIYPFKHQPHKMVKHTKTIRRLLPTNCLNVFDHFMGLALKRLKETLQHRSSFMNFAKFLHIFYGTPLDDDCLTVRQLLVT